jgi:DNA polymerase-1
MSEMLKVTGRQITRKHMKTIILAILYGLGNAELGVRLGITMNEARQFKELFLSVFPGIKELSADLKAMSKRGEPMRTWGGRLYYCEEPRLIKGVLRSFEYKMINFLVQGSSADETKESILMYHESKKDSRLLLTVHDEIEIVAPKKAWKSEMKILKEAMEGLPLDVPMKTDGEVGYSWGKMSSCD